MTKIILNLNGQQYFGGFEMGSITVPLSTETRKKIEKHSEINWKSIAAKAIEEKVEEIEWMANLLKNSEFTEEDAERIGHEIKNAIWKRAKKRFA
ncbi:MAG: hypothetical protein Q7K34_04615 [archaeon]|nr:hypothetical protein [archaeon]